MAEIVPMLILLLTLSLSHATEPGVKLGVTNKGLGFANDIAWDVLKKTLRTLSIPDQHGSDGGINWSLRGIRITGMSGPNTRISLNPGKRGVTLSVYNFGISVVADWSAEFWIIFKFSPSGSLDLGVSRASVNIVAELGQSDGHPSVTAKSCGPNLGVISIDFHGGLVALILNIFKGVVIEKVRRVLEDRVCQIVYEQVNNRANQELYRMKVNVDFAKLFNLDYSLIRTPTVTDKYIELASKGAVYWKDNRQECPFTPRVMPALSEFNNMLYVFVSEYTANTFTYTAHTYGYLQYNETFDNLPSGISDLLNLTGQLKNNYPNSKLELHIGSSSAPSVKFEEQNLTVAAVINVEVVAHTPDGVINPLVLRVTASLTVQPSVANGTLTATITNNTFNIAVIKSDIGDINEKDLNKLIRETIDRVVIPGLNEFCKQGIPLPVTGIFRLYNAQLNLKTGYLQVGADVGYMN